MSALLSIILVVLCLLYIGLIVYTIKREKKRKQQLREKIEESEKQVEELRMTIGKMVADFRKHQDSFAELYESYSSVSRKYESPSKSYIINHLVRLYDVKNLTALARALGVSASSLCQKLKKV